MSFGGGVAELDPPPQALIRQPKKNMINPRFIRIAPKLLFFGFVTNL